MSLRILAVGDPHFKVDNVLETDAMHHSLILLIQRLRPEIVVVEGDLLDKFESIHVRAFNRALQLLQDIRANCQHTYLLIGNHDRPNNNVFLTDEHPFNALKYWDRITIVDKVIVEEVGLAKVPLFFAPYVAPGRFREALLTVGLDHKVENPDCDPANWQKLRSLAGGFCHQEFRGAKMGPIVSEQGDLWPQDGPPLISGHIHDYSKCQSNITYTGTPFQHGRTDTTRKTVSLHTFSQTGGGWQQEEDRFELQVPRKINIKLTLEELLAFDLEAIGPASLIKISVLLGELEFRHVLQHPQVISLLKQGVKIKPLNTRVKIRSDTAGYTTTKISYRQRLQTAVAESSPDTIAIFSELFDPPALTKPKRLILRRTAAA
jgi:hypothetical protein